MDKNEVIHRLLNIITEARDIAWRRDVPHPSCPEYVELHEGMREIMDFIDTSLTQLVAEKALLEE